MLADTEFKTHESDPTGADAMTELSILVSYDAAEGYTVALPDGSTVTALSLAGLQKRLPHARLVLDRKAKAEAEQRRRAC